MFDEASTATLAPGGAGGRAEIAGYASVFGAQDLNGDIVERGAFARSLARRSVRDIKLLYQHAAERPIGVWREVREDARGLFVRGELLMDVPLARETLSLMEAGALNGLSIGFQTVRARRERRGDVRRLLEIDLWEVSVVTFPMAPLARITSVRVAAGTQAAKRRMSAPRDFRQPPPPQSEVRLFTNAVRDAAELFRP